MKMSDSALLLEQQEPASVLEQEPLVPAVLPLAQAFVVPAAELFFEAAELWAAEEHSVF